MKYFKVTYVSQKTLHPEGYKKFHAFVAAETKHTAKLKALEVLAQKDPVQNHRMMYKVPRLEELTESEYLKQTEIQSDWVDEVSTARYCALLSLFGEEEEYGNAERRDADELMESPDEEPEAYARYEALCERVYEALPDDATEEVMQALAKRLWADMKGGATVETAVEAESLNLQAKPGLPTESVDNTENSGEISSDINRSPDATPLVENASNNDDRISQSVREYPHDFATLELEIACALWPGDVEADAVPGEVLRWAKDKVKRREEDLIGWLCALRKVPDILSRSRAFLFDVVRGADDIHLYLNTLELDAHIARYVGRVDGSSPDDVAEAPLTTTAPPAGPDADDNSPCCDDQSCGSDETTPRDWPDLELDIARALWEGELHWEAIPYEVEQWAQKMVKRRDVEMIRWLLALRKVPDILSRSREFVFKVIRTPHDQDIYLTPEAIYAYVARFVEPETTVASEAADVPAIAEPETVDAEATESEIHYSPEENMPAFLRDLKPVSGAVEDGRLFATVDALNARLTDIPAGGSLVLWGLDNGLYHAADGYSSTQLRLLQSGGAASLDWYRDAPCLDEASPCLTLGSALHTALLEPERFAADYLCTPSVNLRTNEGKAQKAEFLQQCREENKTALPEADCRRVCMMRDSARANPTVRALLRRGIAELSVYHRTAHGMLLKVRPDWLGEMSGAAFLLDLKSTGEVNDFGASVEKFGYHIQAAYYRTVVEKVFGREMDFVFCVVGKNLECGRYPVRLGMLDEEDEREGQYCVGELVTTLEVALREGIALDWGTFTRPWWARQADRKRRAEGVAA